MFKFIESWNQKRDFKKRLLAFLAEIEKNLEIYYVMDQRQFIVNGFHMDVWPQVKDLEIIQKHKIIETYANTLFNFNKTFQEYKNYEQWYTSDMKNKTNENAKLLHNLKHEVDSKVKPLEEIIITAGQTLESELLNLGFISN